MCEILDLIIKKFLEFKNLRWKNVHAAVSRTKPILPIYSDFPNQAWLKCNCVSLTQSFIVKFYTLTFFVTFIEGVMHSKTSPQVFTLKIELLHHFLHFWSIFDDIDFQIERRNYC